MAIKSADDFANRWQTMMMSSKYSRRDAVDLIRERDAAIRNAAIQECVDICKGCDWDVGARYIEERLRKLLASGVEK